MKYDAMRFMQLLHKFSKLRSEHSFHRHALLADYMDSDAARSQRSGGFQRDKTCTEDDDLFCVDRLRQNRPAVGEGSQVMHVIRRCSWNRDPHGLCACREQQTVEAKLPAVVQLESF